MHTQPATRRSVLAGGVSVAAALPLAGSVAQAMAASGGIVAEVRGLAARILWAIAAQNMALKVHGHDSSEHDDAAQVTHALEFEFDELCERIFRTPVRSLDDLIARAEIASFWADRDIDGRIEHLDIDADCDARAFAMLLAGVFELAGGADSIGAIRQQVDRAMLQSGGRANV